MNTDAANKQNHETLVNKANASLKELEKAMNTEYRLQYHMMPPTGM